jgi:hypothetical protein
VTETRDRIWDIVRTRCDCGRWGFLSRRDARSAAHRLHPGEHLRPYRCRESAAERWHFGHLSPAALLGRAVTA